MAVDRPVRIIVFDRIVRNKAADTARLSNRSGQQTELGLVLPPTTSTTRPLPTGLLDDEQAAAHLYIGNLLSPLAAQQPAAYAPSGGAAFNSPTSLVHRRTPAADDGEFLMRLAVISQSIMIFRVA